MTGKADRGITLILGGARSGKSRFAQEMAQQSAPPVLFVATAEAGDEEMRRRIAEHRRTRPATWRTIEVTTGLGEIISRQISGARTVLIDCVTLLVNNIFQQHWKDNESLDTDFLAEPVMKEVEQLVHCMQQLPARFILVSNEVGLGLVPPNRMGRVYRDLLGRVNQVLAQHADEVYFMVAGLPLRIKPERS